MSQISPASVYDRDKLNSHKLMNTDEFLELLYEAQIGQVFDQSWNLGNS